MSGDPVVVWGAVLVLVWFVVALVVWLLLYASSRARPGPGNAPPP